MIYSSWDIEQNLLKLVILGHFLPFYPLKNAKNQNFEKWKNLLEISSFYTCVPKITVTWCTFPEIWSETDRTFCHFGPFFALLPHLIILLYIHVYHKWMIYGSWNIRYGKQFFFVILGHLLPFQPSDNPENQNFKIEKTTKRYYHFTHLYLKWQSYDVWFLRYGAQQIYFFVILDRFLPFYPLWTQKNKILKKWKKHLKILSFYKCVPKVTVIWCMVPEI